MWTVWAAMVFVALFCVARYGRNVPLAEDWTMVPALTGHEPRPLEWLWSQNNEHRVPLPRILYLGLLKLTGGDFRAGMVANVLCIAGLAAAAIAVARKLRGSRTAYTDAFFPLVLLHLGHWENLLWSWQLQFVTSVALSGGLLLLIVAHRAPMGTKAAVLAGTALVLLPLAGGNGLVFVPVLAPLLVWYGWRQWRHSVTAWARRAAVCLVTFPVLAVAVTGLYFVSYESPTWYPPSELNVAMAKTSLKFVAMAVGPGAARSWPVAALVVTALLASAVVLLAVAARSRPEDRGKVFGLLLVLAGIAGLAFGVGRGRAALPDQSTPARYALLAAPALIVTYFAWELYGPPKSRRWFQGALLAAVLLVLPWNIKSGFGWRDWYLDGMNRFERDLKGGVPLAELAPRHQQFLLHWNLDTLKANMTMLHESGIGPFSELTNASRLAGLSSQPSHADQPTAMTAG